MAYFLMTLLGFLSVLLMGVVLLQRGRGGGLAGAFGGLGGQSAFGTKAGDVFTKITIGITVAWVLLAGGSGFALRSGADSRYVPGNKEPEKPSVGKPTSNDDADDDKPSKSDSSDKTKSKAEVDDDATEPDDDAKPTTGDKKPDDKQPDDKNADVDPKPNGDKKPSNDKTKPAPKKPADDASSKSEKPESKDAEKPKGDK